MRQERKETGQTNNLNSSRKVIALLDHSVRYANAVTAPGTGTDGSYYFEFQTGNAGQQQTCTQWRWVPTGGTMQWRTWQPPLTGSWNGDADRLGDRRDRHQPGRRTPIFSDRASNRRRTPRKQLNVQFNATSGSPPTSS